MLIRSLFLSVLVILAANCANAPVMIWQSAHPEEFADADLCRAYRADPDRSLALIDVLYKRGTINRFDRQSMRLGRKPKIGQSIAAVTCAWGTPYAIRRTEHASTVTVRLDFEDYPYIARVRVYTTNNRVSRVQYDGY